MYGQSKNPVIQSFNDQEKEMGYNLDSINFDSMTLDDCEHFIKALGLLREVNKHLREIIKNQKEDSGE